MKNIKQISGHDGHSNESVHIVSERAERKLSADATVVILCLLAFLIFLWLLARFYFPAGTDVFAVSGSGDSGSVIETGSRRLNYDADEGNMVVAELVDFRRDVKVRPVEALAWTSAHKGNAFRLRDSLQTMARSSALIQLGEAGQLNIGPDSLIVFKPSTINKVLPDQATAMVLVDGQVDGGLSVQGLPSRRLEFEIPGGMIRLSQDSGSTEELEFTLNVNPDKSSSLALYSGQAVVTAGGQTVMLGSRQGVTVSGEGVVQRSRVLPEAPAVEFPADRSEIRFRNIAPAVSFSWGESLNASAYRFQLARDPGFIDIVADDKTTTPTLLRENLSTGLYYWRVTGLDGWHRSRPSPARRLAVVQDQTEPALQLNPATLMEETGQALISGRADTGSRIYVQGDLVQESGDGHFSHLLQIKQGTSLVTVEAVDAVGNVAYSTQFIHTSPSFDGGE